MMPSSSRWHKGIIADETAANHHALARDLRKGAKRRKKGRRACCAAEI